MNIYEQSEGASSKDINLWENYFSQKMPLDYIELMQNNDGPGLYDEDSDSEFQFLSIKETIDYYEIYHFKDYCPNAIPICMDGNGNFAVYRIDNEKITGIYLIPASEIDWDSSVKVGKFIRELLNIRIEDELNKKKS